MKKIKPRILSLNGLKVVGIYGRKEKGNYNRIEPDFILFSDGETYIEFQEQDYFDYHDCSSSARLINIRKDKFVYDNIIKDTKSFGQVTDDGFMC